MTTNKVTDEQEAAPVKVLEDVQHTTCCIVGGGPAGAVLAYILARNGVDVTLLEKHGDFDRDFRGDTLHPAIMELMDQLGLADRLLHLYHTRLGSFNLNTDGGAVSIDLSHLLTKYPYITFMPQVEFLTFLTDEAKRYPCFHLIMDADVKELIEENGKIVGVRYQPPDGWHAVRAALTVGADGRFSKVRHLIGIELVKSAPPMDVLWFRLPRKPEDGEGVAGTIHDGAMFVMLDRDTEWQIAYAIPKGKYKQIQAAGLPAVRQKVAEALPYMADRMELIKDWKQLSLLAVESSMCRRWYAPGLLLIGDAAHVMSPVAGVGINYAVQDAVAAANLLTAPLQQGNLTVADLAAVQQQREWPVKVMQAAQGAVQERILKGALQAGKPFKLPLIIRLPFVRNIAARLIAFGVRRVRLKV